MGILSIVLFFLGVVFFLLGWRWQNPPNEEAKTALKGLAYLKREITRVQDQVNVLEDKLQTAKQAEIRAVDLKKTEFKEAKPTENAPAEIEPKLPRFISPKYQEVLELAARGQRVPEIAQNLTLSQDAVLMVLKTQAKGVI